MLPPKGVLTLGSIPKAGCCHELFAAEEKLLWKERNVSELPIFQYSCMGWPQCTLFRNSSLPSSLWMWNHLLIMNMIDFWQYLEFLSGHAANVCYLFPKMWTLLGGVSKPSAVALCNNNQSIGLDESWRLRVYFSTLCQYMTQLGQVKG